MKISFFTYLTNAFNNEILIFRFEKKNWLLRQTQSLQLYLLSSKESDYLLSDHYQYIGQQQYYQTV